jgi:Fe-S oxidoreductase
MTEFGSDLISRKKIRPKNIRRKVTYHDPCYLARHAGSRSPRERRVIDEPRSILTAISGLEVVEMEKRGKWTWCAGECGGIKQGFPELARWRAQRLIEEAAATGAEVLVTATPNEQLHVTEVLEAERPSLKCMDIVELLDEAVS